MHVSTSVSLGFRSSIHYSESNALGSAPSSPQPSLFSYSGGADMDFPFLLPTPPTSSSSPSLSPQSLSTDDSSDYAADAVSHWRPADAATHSYTSASAGPWHDAIEPLSLDRSISRVSSSPSPDMSFRSGNHSSSASSVSSDSSTPPPPATQRAELLAKKRKRSTAALNLNADERLQRRRAQHRAVDANRRQRESDAIARLHKLIKQQQQEQQEVGEVSDETGEADEDDTEAGNRKSGRLTVLESSIALIEQLTSACKRMDAACNAKDLQVSRVSNQLHSVAAVIAQQATSLGLVKTVADGFSAVNGLDGIGVPTAPHTGYSQPWTSPHPSNLLRYSGNNQSHSASSMLSVLPSSASSYLLQSDSSHTLRQSTASLLHTMCMALVALPSKVMIDVNDRFLAMSGHRRADVLYHSIEDLSLKDVPQYPASLLAVDEVMDGRKRQGSAVWRCRWADGLVYENYVSFYAIFDEPSVSGGKRLPDKMLLISAAEEAVALDMHQV